MSFRCHYQGPNGRFKTLSLSHSYYMAQISLSYHNIKSSASIVFLTLKINSTIYMLGICPTPNGVFETLIPIQSRLNVLMMLSVYTKFN